MRVAYADTSCLVAVLMGEDASGEVARNLESYDVIVSSNLLEAELRSALRREGVAEDPSAILRRITWMHADRSLTREFLEVLSAGYVRGADLWHLGCAVYLRRSVPTLDFVSLDLRQRAVAQQLEFSP